MKYLNLAAALVLVPLFCSAQSQSDDMGDEALLLNLQKVNIGTLSGVQEKKQYLTTIQLEKQKIQTQMLKGVFDNAYDLYKAGDYERAQELARKILAIDPNFKEAKTLFQASQTLKGSGGTLNEQSLADTSFNEGMALYKKGRLVEASAKWEDVISLAPDYVKAKYWFDRVQKEIADEHVRRGNEAYAQKRYREALDQWYNALIINKNDSALVSLIGKVEGELRSQQANLYLKDALEFYGDGKLNEAYASLKKVLEVQPMDTRARELVGEVKTEIAGTYVDSGKQLYAKRLYLKAISIWKTAREWGYDRKYVDSLIARAKEQMKREKDEKLRRIALRKKAAEEAAEREKEAQEEEKKQQMQNVVAGSTETATTGGTDTGITSLPVGPGGITQERKEEAAKRYLKGLGLFQAGEYDKARAEWVVAKQLDPSNSNADAGLRRIDQMFGGAR